MNGRHDPIKLNFGCGANHMPDWQNYDAELDITQPLLFSDNIASFIFAEHVVEHVPYASAIAFFKECLRVLRVGGVLRIAVPSITRIMDHATSDYITFTQEWAPTNDLRGAMWAIAFAHGHQTVWNDALLRASLYLGGFDHLRSTHPGHSDHDELKGVEYHGRVISDAFNEIETVVVEATKL